MGVDEVNNFSKIVLYTPIFIFTILAILIYSIGWAQEKPKPLLTAEDAEQLKNTILNLPKLGVPGIILFLVAVVAAIGVWWWWNSMSKKVTHRENEKQRRRDQAENKIENQRISDELNEAHDNVEEIRKEDGAGIKPRPPKPKG